MKKFLFACVVLSLWTDKAFCEPVSDDSVHLVLDGISNVVAVGSTNNLQFQIVNSSTNFVYFPGMPEQWLMVSLTDDSGKSVWLTKDLSGLPGGGPVFGMEGPKTNDYVIALPLNSTIKSGGYKLNAEMSMYYASRPLFKGDSGERYFKVKSNTLEVTVKN